MTTAAEHREHGRRLRELYAKEKDGGLWGIDLLPALARVRDQLADEAELAGRPTMTSEEVEVWAQKIGSCGRARPRRTEWEYWVSVTFGEVLEDRGDPWVERTRWFGV